MNNKVRIMVTLHDLTEDQDPEMEHTDMIISEIQDLLNNYYKQFNGKAEAVL